MGRLKEKSEERDLEPGGVPLCPIVEQPPTSDGGTTSKRKRKPRKLPGGQIQSLGSSAEVSQSKPMLNNHLGGMRRAGWPLCSANGFLIKRTEESEMKCREGMCRRAFVYAQRKEAMHTGSPAVRITVICTY